jgi:hypothetical protein
LLRVSTAGAVCARLGRDGEESPNNACGFDFIVRGRGHHRGFPSSVSTPALQLIRSQGGRHLHSCCAFPLRKPSTRTAKSRRTTRAGSTSSSVDGVITAVADVGESGMSSVSTPALQLIRSQGGRHLHSCCAFPLRKPSTRARGRDGEESPNNACGFDFIVRGRGHHRGRRRRRVWQFIVIFFTVCLQFP